jgi:hypothetical protein
VAGPVVIEGEGKGDRYVASMQGTGPRSDEEIQTLLGTTKLVPPPAGAPAGPGAGSTQGRE